MTLHSLLFPNPQSPKRTRLSLKLRTGPALRLQLLALGDQPSGRESPKFSPFGPGRLDRKWTGPQALEASRGGEDNVCFQLEDKCGGKIIYRQINILILYRGRNYDPKNRPVIPVMLWKPYPPIYPKLVKNIADGLTFEETKELRNRGLNCPPLMKLTKNGVYVNVVDRVREAFNTEEVVRPDCTHVGTTDCKRIGVKLRDLAPCIPLLFKDVQIILWRGKRDQEQDSRCMDLYEKSTDA